MRARDRGRALGRILALGTALAVICPAAPGVATAQQVAQQGQQQQPQQKKVYKIYVVGDSYSSGEGVSVVMQTGRGPFTVPSYFDVKDPRHQSKVSAAIQAAARLQAANPDIQVEVHVVASSGATTSDFFEAQRRDPLDAPRRNRPQDGADPTTWHDKDDLTVNGPQIDQIPADADVVIMGFGGNDAFFGPLARTFYDDQESRPAIMQKLEQLLAHGQSAEHYQRQAETSEKGYAPTLIARLLQVMQAIQNRAPNAKIVVQNYPLAADPAHTSNYDLLDEGAMKAMRDFGLKINEVIKRTAEICGCAELADVSQALKGHELNTKDPAINSPSKGAGGNASNWAQNEAVHPNLKGVSRMADPVAAALAKRLGLKTPPAQGEQQTDTSKIRIFRNPAPDTDGDGTPDYLDNDWDGDGTPNAKDRNPNSADPKPASPNQNQPGTQNQPGSPQKPATDQNPARPNPGDTGQQPPRQDPTRPAPGQQPPRQNPGRTPAPPGSGDVNGRPPAQPTPPRTDQQPPRPSPSPGDGPTPPRPNPGPAGQPQTPPPTQQRPTQQRPTQQPPAPQPPAPPQSSGGGKTSQSKASAAPRRGPVIPASTPMRSVSAPSMPTTPSAPRFDPNFGPPGSPKPSQLGGGLAGVNPPAPPTVTGPTIAKPQPPLSGGGKRGPQPKPGGFLSTDPSGASGGGGGTSGPAPSGGGGSDSGGSSAPSSAPTS